MAKQKKANRDELIKEIVLAIPLICTLILLADQYLVKFGIIQEPLVFKLPLWLIWTLIFAAILLPVSNWILIDEIDENSEKKQK